MTPANISSHFFYHQEKSQNAKYSAIDKKKSYFNKEIKNLIKKKYLS